MPPEDGAPSDAARRFGGTGRLYGEDGLARLRRAHVCVIGIGGVGSWSVEALARSAVGRLTLMDLDQVCVSNVNRQVHALDGSLGQAKVLAMAERVRAINPDCQVETVEDFVTPDNIGRLLDLAPDALIDAIDQVRVKAALIAACRERGRWLVTAGAAGGQVDPTRVAVADLSRTVQDPLLARVRALLRKHYGFPRNGKFGVEAVFSTEPLRYPEAQCAGAGLACAGFGSAVSVTATFGLFAAARVLNRLAAG